MTRFLLVLLLGLVLLAPLPLGGNREQAWTLCAMCAATLALCWAVFVIALPRRPILPLPVAPLVMLLAVCGWVVFQASDLAPAGWQHPLWNMAGQALGAEIPGRISVSSEDSLVALQRMLTYALVFFLGFQLCRERRLAAATFTCIAIAGLTYALYGLAIYWGGFGALPWFSEEHLGASVRGTFVNRNSFATYLGLCILCGLAGTYRRLVLSREQIYSVPGRPAWRTEQFLIRAWLPLAALLLMLSALLLTQSRAGFGSFAAGAFALLGALSYRRPFRSTRALAVVAVVAIVMVIAFVLTSKVLLERLDYLSMDWPDRLRAYTLTASAIGDNPELGFGYGTFADSFRVYRDTSIAAHLDMAHNTYLENIFELGWPAATMLFLCIAWLTAICLKGLRNRGRDWIYPATGLAATLLVAIHSLFDFSLQMPAIAMTYALILGAACAQSYPSRKRVIPGA